MKDGKCARTGKFSYIKNAAVKKKKKISYTVFISSAFIRLSSQPFLSKCKRRPISCTVNMAAGSGVLLPTVCL